MRRSILLAAALVLTACGTSHHTATSSPPSSAPSTAPAPTSPASLAPTTSALPTKPIGHVVVVMMENHSYADIIGSPMAPYLNSLASRGANLTQMFAITHPSQPNYVALFSGSTQGVTNDVCPQSLYADNLGHQLIAAGLSFAAYSEGLPTTGSRVCNSGAYARRHAPWTNFADLHGTVSQPFTSFPSDFSRLPALSFVVPDVNDDMHDGSVATGDAWIRTHLHAYADWAATHDSQLVVAWDEDDHSQHNQIPTLIFGAGIKPQKIATHLTLYSLLRYLEDRFGLTHLGSAATAATIPLPS